MEVKASDLSCGAGGVVSLRSPPLFEPSATVPSRPSGCSGSSVSRGVEVNGPGNLRWAQLRLRRPVPQRLGAQGEDAPLASALAFAETAAAAAAAAAAGFTSSSAATAASSPCFEVVQRRGLRGERGTVARATHEAI